MTHEDAEFIVSRLVSADPQSDVDFHYANEGGAKGRLTVVRWHDREGFSDILIIDNIKAVSGAWLVTQAFLAERRISEAEMS